ncbi:hypothetical protein B0H65DRAFT_512669 [Neurospora tetraspora]|uniref:Uncharacterized protein n=1 Tax=Neurospora tetraspora TaxID=94610 RepID=A0AAE0J173_9PEZI|nr:hypothetical protein B0H65DRAFT_512669 [Neurospora tetraspora]
MTIHLSLPCILLGFVYAGTASTQTTVTIPKSLIGFTTDFEAQTSSWLSCPDDSTFHVSSTYATCMTFGDVWFNSDMVTACSWITQYLDNGKSHICTGWDAYCLTTTIYESYPSASLSWISYGCEPVTGDRHFTLYRNLGTSASMPTTSPRDTGPTGAPSPGSSVSALSTLEPTSISDSTTPSSSSKAWIAGAAAGPVIALLAIGALVFWWKRRRAKKHVPASESDGPNQVHEAPIQSPKSDEVSELPSPWSPRPGSELESRESRMAGDPRAACVEVRSPETVFEVE